MQAKHFRITSNDKNQKPLILYYLTNKIRFLVEEHEFIFGKQLRDIYFSTLE